MSLNPDETKWYTHTSSTQTMRTWARHLTSFEEIPSEFQTEFPKNKEQLPYTILIPEDRLSLFQKRNKKLICMHEDRFILLESLRNEIKTTSNLFTEVLYLERGKVLLHSWLKIKTLSGTLSLRFNTTNDYLFEPVIEKIRQEMSRFHPDDTISGANHENKPDLSPFDYLNSVNFKYMNYGRGSIQPDDSVISLVYQPERRIQEFTLFNKTLFMRHTTAHLTILTEKELILINENKRIKSAKDSLYGGVFTYIPRHQIHDISFISNSENTHCIMEIILPEDTHLALEFSLANEELKQLQKVLG